MPEPDLPGTSRGTAPGPLALRTATVGGPSRQRTGSVGEAGADDAPPPWTGKPLKICTALLDTMEAKATSAIESRFGLSVIRSTSPESKLAAIAAFEHAIEDMRTKVLGGAERIIRKAADAQGAAIDVALPDWLAPLRSRIETLASRAAPLRELAAFDRGRNTQTTESETLFGQRGAADRQARIEALLSRIVESESTLSRLAEAIPGDEPMRELLTGRRMDLLQRAGECRALCQFLAVNTITTQAIPAFDRDGNVRHLIAAFSLARDQSELHVEGLADNLAEVVALTIDTGQGETQVETNRRWHNRELGLAALLRADATLRVLGRLASAGAEPADGDAAKQAHAVADQAGRMLADLRSLLDEDKPLREPALDAEVLKLVVQGFARLRSELADLIATVEDRPGHVAEHDMPWIAETATLDLELAQMTLDEYRCERQLKAPSSTARTTSETVRKARQLLHADHPSLAYGEPTLDELATELAGSLAHAAPATAREPRGRRAAGPSRAATEAADTPSSAKRAEAFGGDYVPELRARRRRHLDAARARVTRVRESLRQPGPPEREEGWIPDMLNSAIESLERLQRELSADLKEVSALLRGGADAALEAPRAALQDAIESIRDGLAEFTEAAAQAHVDWLAKDFLARKIPTDRHVEILSRAGVITVVGHEGARRPDRWGFEEEFGVTLAPSEALARAIGATTEAMRLAIHVHFSAAEGGVPTALHAKDWEDRMRNFDANNLAVFRGRVLFTASQLRTWRALQAAAERQ